jgi:predicted dehydrogenase
MLDRPTGIAIIGCGYVADAYRYCLDLHPHLLSLKGCFDRDPQRLEAFTKCWGDKAYSSIDTLLADETVEIVLNLTDPHNHFDVTQAALLAGKHVYSEKPLAMDSAEAKELIELAKRQGLSLSAAPCNILGEAAQTAWRAIRDGKIGKVRLIYAELDDGMVHRANYQNWISRSGQTWPARGEFETGCTYEHAGYALSLLVAMFGPVRSVSAFSSLIIPDKETEPKLTNPAPDFSSGCLLFDDGVVARVTNSIVAPYDHRFRIIGEEGTIDITELWDYASSVILRSPPKGRFGRIIERRWPFLNGRKLKLVRKPPLGGGRSNKPTMDFMRGVAELALSLRENRPCKLSAELADHITQVTEILQHPDRFSHPAKLESDLPAMQPEAWAMESAQ